MATGEFPLPQDGYLAFDSLGLKAHLKQRLTEEGVFTDMAYEGSNIASLIDIMSFTFNTLIYYMNRTSVESMGSDAQLYENLNRIVKTVGYNPVGRQSSILTFNCSAQAAMANGLYTIPRYTYLNVGPISYSVNEDITFFKSLSAQAEYLEDISKNKLLYQGRFIEYPVYNAIGDENEIVYLIPGDKILIDHFNINCYVYDTSSGKWSEWIRTNSLYLENSNDKKYEIRLNENMRYELKFGNDINGKKLNTNDQVAIYYLKSDGTSGDVGVNALQAGKLIKLNTTQFSTIFADIQNEILNIIPDSELINLRFDNNSSSTYYSKEESVESMRSNAAATFRSQYRLVTEADFQNYIKTNYSNLIHDVKVVNNWSYLNSYLKYFYNLGLTDPNSIGRVLYNQVNFADSCNFNNVYMFIVPKTVPSNVNQISYLNPALKSLIINSMQEMKVLTCEPIILDPVYMGFDVCIPTLGNVGTLDDANKTELYILKNPNSRRDSTSIQSEVLKIFDDYFTRSNVNLGQIIDISYLTNAILNIEGVDNFYTRRTDNPTVRYEGLSLLVWNPIYNTDIKMTTQNVILSYFQLPYLYNKDNFVNKITVESLNKVYENIEY